MLRRGQAMVESLLAVLIITFLFLSLFGLSRLLMGKVMAEHAAMRVARARAVGFNDFMCLKSARVAMIPSAGKRLWPTDDTFGDAQESGRVRTYMESPDEARARGLLEYEGWQPTRLLVDPGDGTLSRVRLRDGWIDVRGEAGIEQGYTYYLEP